MTVEKGWLFVIGITERVVLAHAFLLFLLCLQTLAVEHLHLFLLVHPLPLLSHYLSDLIISYIFPVSASLSQLFPYPLHYSLRFFVFFPKHIAQSVPVKAPEVFDQIRFLALVLCYLGQLRGVAVPVGVAEPGLGDAGGV